jgi:putative membrane protein
MKTAIVAAAAVLAMAATPAMAKNAKTVRRHAQTQASNPAAAKKAVGDEAFVKKALEGGMAEVELGKLATQKAASDSVKQFGQRMVDDHSKAGDELKKIAQDKNITVPTAVSAKEKADQDRLSKLSGAEFDRAYMQLMLADHRKDVNEFRMESKSGKDPDVKAFAAKTLPTLEEHLKLAQDANKAVGTSGKK